MSRQPISFRLTEEEYEVLEKNRQPEESISLCAARLLREKLGLVDSNGDSLFAGETLENLIIRKVWDEVEKLKTQLDLLVDRQVYHYVNSEISVVEDKIINRLVPLEESVDSLVYSVEQLEKTKTKTSTRSRKTPQTQIDN